MPKAKGPERIDKLVKTLRQWQGIERKSIDSCAAIMEKTENPLIRQFMEIIRNDSVQHHRVQQFIIDTLTTTPVSLTPEDLGQVWEEIEAHDQAEKEVIGMAKELQEMCGKSFFVQRHLLEYLLIDEQKHDTLLEQLEDFKSKLYPYG